MKNPSKRRRPYKFVEKETDNEKSAEEELIDDGLEMQSDKLMEAAAERKEKK